MKATRCGGFALLLSLAGAVQLHAQQPASYERARAALSGQARVEFESLVSDARTRGLPIEPLVDKVLEGSAKGVPPARITPVLRKLSEQLVRAQTLLGRGAAAADIVAVADVLQQGVSTDVVVKLRGKGNGKEPFAAVVRSYADLISRGMSSERALEVISARLRGNGKAGVDLPSAVRIPPGQQKKNKKQ